jgi:hypothetical protein
VNECIGSGEYDRICLANPEFTKLLVKLRPLLTEKGLSASVDKDLLEVIAVVQE